MDLSTYLHTFRSCIRSILETYLFLILIEDESDEKIWAGHVET